MGINDLLVSYNLVEIPSYMQDYPEEPVDTEETSIINLENLDRVLNRKKENGFAGWNLPEQQTYNSQHNNSKYINTYMSTQKDTFNLAMNSYLSKHPEDTKYRDTLTAIASKESNFNATIKNKASSASGYFLFIDSTRKLYAPNLTREQFLNNPEELISAAVKLLKANRKISNRYTNVRGLSLLLIDYGMWFSPKALTNYLKTGKSDFKDPQGTSLMQVLRKMA